MTSSIRHLSRAEAASQARALALDFAVSEGMEGRLVDVQQDVELPECEGKTPVHWAAIFTSVRDGVELDPPTVLLVNLRTREVDFSEWWLKGTSAENLR